MDFTLKTTSLDIRDECWNCWENCIIWSHWKKVMYSKEIHNYSYQSKCNLLLSTSDSHHHVEKWQSCSSPCSCSLEIIVKESGTRWPRGPLTGVSMFSLCLAGSSQCVSRVTSRWISTKWNPVSGVLSRLVLKAVWWNRSVHESLNVAWPSPSEPEEQLAVRF